MFGYKSVLQLSATYGLLGQGSPLWVDKGEPKIELFDFSYDIVQDTDENGKPQGEVRAGKLTLSFANLPTTEMLEWILNSRKYKDGNIVVFDMDGMPIQKISFSNGACVALDINYKEDDENYCSTVLSIVAKNLLLGEVKVENEWKNV